MAKIGLDVFEMDRIYEELYRYGSVFYKNGGLNGVKHNLEEISALVGSSNVGSVIQKAREKIDAVINASEGSYNKIGDFLYSQIVDYRQIRADIGERFKSVLEGFNDIYEELETHVNLGDIGTVRVVSGS